MKIDLTGKKAIVSGSTSGIGLGIAKGLAEAGANVIIAGRSSTSLNRALKLLRSDVPKAKVQGLVLDLSTVEGVQNLKSNHPETDILINNLGIYEEADFFETTDENWIKFYETNVLSGVRLAREYLPGMAKRAWGRVIFISSESGIAIPSNMINYGVTKSSNLAVSHGLAKRMSGTGVTVNAVLPGPTFTEGLAEMVKDSRLKSGRSSREEADEFVRHARPSSIIQRAAEVEEVANLVVYISSKQSSATTGAALRVDGGVVDSLAI